MQLPRPLKSASHVRQPSSPSTGMPGGGLGRGPARHPLNDRARFSDIAFKWHGFLTRVWPSRGSSDGWYVGKPTCRIGHFLPNSQKVARMSKLGFPTSDPAPMVIPLDHGLQSHVTKRRGIAHGHLAKGIQKPMCLCVQSWPAEPSLDYACIYQSLKKLLPALPRRTGGGNKSNERRRRCHAVTA